MDLNGLSVAGVENFVDPSVSVGTSSAIRLGSCGMLGSWTSSAIRLGSCGMLGSLISTTYGGSSISLLEGGYLALPNPFMGSRHFLPDPYLEFTYFPLLVQHPILGITLLLHLNCHPLMGFICLQ